MRAFSFYLFFLLSMTVHTMSYAKGCVDEQSCNSKKDPQDIALHLSKGLISAMTYDAKTKLRAGDPEKAIQAYIDNGYLPQKRNQRADYVDYWIINKPINFMDHDLLLIENEYMDQYIGCCVNTGVGISVKVKANLGKLKQFAADNICTFEILNQTEFNKSFWVFDSAYKLGKQKAKYAKVSCRHSDALSFE